MGIAACIDTLTQVVSGVTPVRAQGVPFTRLPEESRGVPMARGRVFDLAVVGSADTDTTGFRERRTHLIDLLILYPAHFGGRGLEHVTIAEDVARITVALGESNVGLMAGVGVVYPPTAHEVEPTIPEGKASPSGLKVTMTFQVETREA